jgi:5-methylcytosine-specific restriction endonuclease McrA
MARLKTIKPRLATLAPRIGRAIGDEQTRLREREKVQPWRQWYHSAEWQRLRRQAFVRDGYVCQRSGVLCIGKGNDPDAPIANHRIPHKGDRKLFFDLDNIETVSKEVHDGLIHREEKAGYLAGP